MLILTRRVGKSLMIGDDVSVTVLGVRGDQVRIGVDAPKDIAVHRERSTIKFSRKRAQIISTPRPYPAKIEEIGRRNRYPYSPIP